jgi:hypothetical protein
MWTVLCRAPAACAALTVSACAAPGAAPQPARLAAPVSAACVQQIEAFVASATGRQVALSDAAFAGSDELVITQNVPRDVAGRPFDGRQLAPVLESFRLTRHGAVCVLTYPKAPSSIKLSACRCVAATP